MGNDEKSASVEKKSIRETWQRRFDFLIACIGFSVGLGNIWRFPYLCFKNGGGAFLIPYFICAIIGGIPLFYLEVSVGQFMGNAGINAWRICPLFQGIGVATTIIMFFSNTFFNVVMAWAIYYLINSFQSELPWATCGHEWNRYCRDTIIGNVTGYNSSFEENLIGSNDIQNTTMNTSRLALDPVVEFWENKVLAISDGIDQPGEVKTDLAMCLLAAWVVVYCCICKGIKSSGKVMYFTATSPFLLMFILVIRNCMLDGAVDGIIFYLKPDLTKLTNIEVWVDAASQILFSYSIGCGSLVAIGSYNKINHNSYRDSLLYALTNTLTSFLAGFIIFTILGHMAAQHNTTIDKVVESGPGLAFLAYPKAITMMPLAPMWSVMFFLMVLLLGLDSQFMGVEGVITAVVDQWPDFLRRGYRREIFAAFLCLCNYTLGLSMVTNGGIYVFELFNFYSTCLITLLIAFCECAAIAWIYGVRRFYKNLEMMIGHRLSPFMAIMWSVLTPIFYLMAFICSVMTYSELEYRRSYSVYTYPSWAIGIGWTMSAFSVMFIPLMVVYNVWKQGLTPKTMYLLLKPQEIPDRNKEETQESLLNKPPFSQQMQEKPLLPN